MKTALQTACKQGVLIVHFPGNADLLTRLDENSEQLSALVERGARKILLNFEHVEYLGAAALGKLVTLRQKVKAFRGRLRLCRLRPQVRELFTITRLHTIFDIRDDETSALRAFGEED